MKTTWTHIDSDVTPLGTLTLHRYEAEDGTVGYEVRIDDAFLMATHGASSERAMASLAHDRLQAEDRGGLDVLVGGLGCGHTLRAALDLPRVTRVVVSEIGPKVLEWNRRFFGPFNGEAVLDPRVEVVFTDLWDVLAARPGAFDLLLLDVDNGRDHLAAAGNARLFAMEGIRLAAAALRPGGVLAIWAPHSDPTLVADVGTVFDHVEDLDTRAIGRAVLEPGDHVLLGYGQVGSATQTSPSQRPRSGA